MILTETELPGAFVIDVEPLEDERGFFARAFDQRDFEERGLNPLIKQTNLAYNHHKGTLRGLHVQIPPAAETKLVRATRGTILDVIVDLRPESATYLRHVAVELSHDSHRALYVPERFAHGYQVLIDETETSYQVSASYSPPHERVLPYDDPLLGVEWPLPVTAISEKDRNAPLLETWEERLKQEMTLGANDIETAV